jgi:cyanophycin synthetase
MAITLHHLPSILLTQVIDMNIIDIRTLRGPNYWSTYRQHLIEMKLDLGDSEDYPTNKIDGFASRLEELMPTLYGHRCSKGKQGGFLERVREGTWLGHVVEHVALELQSLAGMPCGYGRTRSAGARGVYYVVFAYEVAKAGVYAARAAVDIVHALESDRPYDISKDIKELSRINRNEGLGPSTQSLIAEARKRGIPYRRLDEGSLIMLGQGKFQKLMRATMACTTSSIGVELAYDKNETKQILSAGFIPVPEGREIETRQELDAVMEDMGFPLVIKPADGNHGRGVTTRIYSKEQAYEAFQRAKEISKRIIAERFVEGTDYRFLIINYKLAAVARRTPPAITGNNTSTIEQLIEEINRDPRRGEGHEKVLTTVKMDASTHALLVEKQLTFSSVLPVGEILYLKETANISTGGTSSDVTDIVHPHNIFLAERIARLMDLDICGIDIIAQDISKPIKEGTGAVLEVNAGPGFRMHLSPTKGWARNVAAPVIDMLFPGHIQGRIPIVAVTGTNGKTTTTRLIAHIAKYSGRHVGYTTSDGIYIQDEVIHYGDCSGPASAEAVLRDPIVDFAVLECARGGILRSGLGFDKCDVSVITNIASDHLGLHDIASLEELAKVKSVIARSTFDSGFAVLNADDEIVYNLKDELDCNIALFSTNADNEYIRAHCDKGKTAAVIEDGCFVLCDGNWKTKIAKVEEVPLTLGGKASCMIKNVLPAILASAAAGCNADTIRAALMSFIPSPQTTPGRMNIFDFGNFSLMVDYAHNAHATQELGRFLQHVPADIKVGIIAGIGDRRNEDIEEVGYEAGKIFNEIIIRHDNDGRGRTNEEFTALLTKGILRANNQVRIKVISDELKAIEHAVRHAMPGSFIVVCSDKVQQSLEFAEQLKEELMHATKIVEHT